MSFLFNQPLLDYLDFKLNQNWIIIWRNPLNLAKTDPKQQNRSRHFPITRKQNKKQAGSMDPSPGIRYAHHVLHSFQRGDHGSGTRRPVSKIQKLQRNDEYPVLLSICLGGVHKNRSLEFQLLHPQRVESVFFKLDSIFLLCALRLLTWYWAISPRAAVHCPLLPN